MIVTNFYAKVERITYTFDVGDIRQALMGHFGIDPKTAVVYFDIEDISGDDEIGQYEATLELHFETQTENKQED